MPYTMADFRAEYIRDHLPDLTPAERRKALQRLSAEERLEGLSLEERLEGFSPKAIQQFLQRSTQEPSSRKRKKMA